MSQQKPIATYKFFIGKKRLLTLFGVSSASMGLLMLSLSLATNNWITTYERLTKYNVTTVVAVNSGLWRKCWRSQEIVGMTKETLWNDNMKEFPEEIEKNCSFISYFKDRSKSTGELKAPEGILYEMRTAAIFSLIGFVALLIGCSISALSYCDLKLKKCIFIASGFYVLSGVFLLIGIVLYVGSISQAFDIKNNDMETDSQYYFDYGISFYLSVLAFILTEFSGVFCIYLYIAKRKHHNKEPLPFEELKPTKSVESAINCLNFNRHRPWVALDQRSEVSPISQVSHQSYQFNRRYSDQVLLKLQQVDNPHVKYQPQYSYATPPHDNINRFLNCNSLNSQFTSEYRADQPSPLLPLMNRGYTPSNTIGSQHVLFLSEANHAANPEGAMGTSLILKQCTYFDSPAEEQYRQVSPIGMGIVCHTCHLTMDLCTCKQGLLAGQHGLQQDLILSQPSNQVPATLLGNHNQHTDIKDPFVNFSSNTLNNIAKPRKITAV